jgi:hypothetical protein
MTFTVKTAADPLTTIPAIRHELADLDPLLPLTRTVTMEQRLSDSLATFWRKSEGLSLLFAASFGDASCANAIAASDQLGDTPCPRSMRQTFVLHIVCFSLDSHPLAGYPTVLR